MAAAALDGVVVTLLLLIGYAAVAVFLFLLDPRGFSFPDVGLAFSLTTAFAVLVVYQTLAWWLTGRTYGDLVMGLRVVGFRGGPCGWPAPWCGPSSAPSSRSASCGWPSAARTARSRTSCSARRSSTTGRRRAEWASGRPPVVDPVDRR